MIRLLLPYQRCLVCFVLLVTTIAVHAARNATNTTTTKNTTNNAPSAAATNTPTITSYPTITPGPTYPDICYICGTESNALTNPNQEIMIQNQTLSCGDLALGGLKRMIPPNYCPILQRAGCACTDPFPTASPSLSPKPTGLTTYYPTVTAWPTNTHLPTHSEKCNVCGDDTLEIVDHSATSSVARSAGGTSSSGQGETIRFNGIIFSCYEVYSDGITGFIPRSTCQAFETRIQAVISDPSSKSPGETGCTCTLKGSGNTDSTGDNVDNGPATSPTGNNSTSSSLSLSELIYDTLGIMILSSMMWIV